MTFIQANFKLNKELMPFFNPLDAYIKEIIKINTIILRYHSKYSWTKEKKPQYKKKEALLSFGAKLKPIQTRRMRLKPNLLQTQTS